MVREIITLNVGQCGVQLGQSVLEQYCAEHEINANGEKNEDTDDDCDRFLTFFKETKSKQYKARGLMIDSEPTAIDNVRNSKYSKLFDFDDLISGNTDAENNFACGYYSIKKLLVNDINDRIRKLIEECDNVQGFIINHSVGGGTGSGLGSAILDDLYDKYRIKIRLGFQVYPSSVHSNCVTDVYNSVLATHQMKDNANTNVIYDNEKIHEMCRNNLNILKPSYHHMNRLISRNISAITTPFRYQSQINVDLHQFQKNLVPFPHLHFMISSMGSIIPKFNQKEFDSIYESVEASPLIKSLRVPPIVNSEIAEYALPYVDRDTSALVKDCFNPKNFFIKVEDFDPEEDKYMGLVAHYSQNIESKCVNAKFHSLINKKKVRDVGWGSWYEFGSYDAKYTNVTLKNDINIAPSERTMSMVANNTVMSSFLSERIVKKFDMMYAQKAYIHHYISQGMEKEEFKRARENLLFLHNDYRDCWREDPTDDDEETTTEDDDEPYW